MPILAAVAMVAASGVFAAAAPAQAATTTLCNSQTAAVAGGAYTVQNNEWNSSAPECITTDGNADFTVANSSINLSGGAPGGYPSIYKGCHWGACTSNSGLPIPVSSMTPGEVTTSWSTTQTGGAYDVAYDIWYNQTPTTSGQPNAEEMMIWINHAGGVEPFGSVVASNVSIGGRIWTIWEGRMSTWNTVSYVLNTGTTSVSNLDVDQLAADSVQRGYMTNSDYLIDVEAGTEIWNGDVGFSTNSYSVNVGGGTTPPPPPGSGPVTGYQGLCLDDRAASTAQFNPVQVYTCNGTGAQQWTYTNNTLQVLGNCLDVNGGGTANGTTVDLYPCNGTGAQVWQHQSNGEYLNPQSGKCLDDTGFGGSGTQAQIWACGDGSNQQWSLP
ncbi:MAG TPA: ricin-type beta-trefoil lectin domain protein [Trebonia sp.]|nr:ricin-type beta-trefoil lectin domain protein [Trebonia sp.]